MKLFHPPTTRLRMIFVCCLLIGGFAGSAQQSLADSLEKAMARMAEDTGKVQKLNDLVGRLEFSDPAKAAGFAEHSIALAKKLHDTIRLVVAYRLRGVLYVDKTQLDSGKLCYDKALVFVKDASGRSFRKQLGLLTQNYGVIYNYKESYDSAIMMYLAAARIFRDISEESLLFYPYNNLCYIYTFLGDNKKALQYATEAHAASLQLNNPNLEAFSRSQEIGARLELQQFDTVKPMLDSQLVKVGVLQNKYLTGKTHNFFGMYYLYGAKQYDSALWHFKRALAIMKEVNNQYEIASVTQNVGNAYLIKGNYAEAVTWLQQSLALGKAADLDQVQKYSLENLVIAEEKRGNAAGALVYCKELLTIRDSVTARSNRKQVNELEARYQGERKAFQIKELQKDKQIQALSLRQKTLLNYVLLGAATILLLVFLMTYRNYRHKRRMQQQKISELETEKLLMATEAVLKGEEQERARLAKDLHDGLSGMLSGAKYSLQHMQGNLVMTPENQQAFERGMDMLDSSIREMRRVAQNMMPEALIRFGLDIALRDYCTEINKGGILKTIYQSMGMEGIIVEQTRAIAIFRVVQELINNVIKHAAATEVLIQLFHEREKLLVNVEDDGKGFDKALLEDSRGMGWNNIRSRVDYLKGKLDIRTGEGKGTSVSIEFNIVA